jgi:hypothetical protein
MLTADLIKANAVLATIPDEQINALVQLSKNDEESVIGTRVGELHGMYDRDIKEALGLDKPAGVKTYAWLKDTILPMVKVGTESAVKIKAANDKVLALEKSIAENTGDKDLAQKLKDAQDKLIAATELHAKEKGEYTTKYAAKEKEVTTYRLDQAFNTATSDVKWIDEKVLNKSVRNAIIKQAKETVLAKYTPEFDNEGNVILRDSNGTIQLNKSNGLKPYTIAEFVLADEAVKGLIQGVKKKGTGDPADDGDPDPAGTTIDMTEVKSQVQATIAIEKLLMKQALVRGTPEFVEARNKLWAELKIADLPTR